VAGIPTLDVLAHNISFTHLMVCPLIDAKKGEVYTALYRGNGRGRLKKLTSDLALKPEMLLKMVKELTIFIGDGVEVYRDKLERDQGKNFFAPFYLHQPRASILAKLALENFRRGEVFKEEELLPLYCRLPEAEIIWKERFSYD
jgi:tRNA threonylcarbamoyladenosine biosynthesis protein TsaB